MALLRSPAKKPLHCVHRSAKCDSVGANSSRGGTAKMSALGLNADTTMKAIGTSDHKSIAATAAALPMVTAARLGRMARHLPAQAPQVADAEQERDEHHEPSRRGGGAERVEAERVLVQVHG